MHAAIHAALARAALLVPSCAWTIAAHAAPQAPGFHVSTFVQQTDITNPVDIAFLPSGQCLVAERTGQIWLKSGAQSGVCSMNGFRAVLAGTITGTGAEYPNTERGILSIAVDPRFGTGTGENDYVYVSQTRMGTPPCLRDVVTRHLLDADPATPSLGTEELVWQSDQRCNGTNGHYGGDIDFVPGDLERFYLVLGDHGPEIASVQDPASTVGKVLRIRRDGTESPVIMAKGLRNPFRASVDDVSGALYVGNVGSNSECSSTTGAWEELNLLPLALQSPIVNFGWPCQEGPLAPSPDCHCRAFDHLAACSDPCDASFRLPEWTYSHEAGEEGGNCIIAGPVYRSTSTTAFPSTYQDCLFVGDYVRGWIKYLPVDPLDGSLGAPSVFMEPGRAHNVVDIEMHPLNGSLYFVVHNPSYAPSVDPYNRPSGVYRVGIAQAVATYVQNDPLQLHKVNFYAAGYGPTTTYAWDFGDGTCSDQRNPLHIYSTVRAQYLVRLGLTDAGDEIIDTVEVATGLPPTITIVEPTPAVYVPQLPIVCDATALDEFGNPIVDPGGSSPSPYTWQLFWIHGHGEEMHEHPLSMPVQGQTVEFPAPGVLSGHDLLNIKVKVVVADADGITGTEILEIEPATVIALAAAPAGPMLTWSGSGHSTTGEIVLFPSPGSTHTLSAPSSWNGVPFARWRDGNVNATRSITVPTQPRSLVACYGTTFCLADINGDDAVNSQDFFDFMTLWGGTSANCWTPGFPAAIDMNGDCLKNSSDFFDFITAFSNGC